MTPDDERSCGRCAWFEVPDFCEDGSIGLCHLHPPILAGVEPGRVDFTAMDLLLRSQRPAVARYDISCREYTKRETER